ncbi:unnamed protein product [Arctogadus glacialis]
MKDSRVGWRPGPRTVSTWPDHNTCAQAPPTCAQAPPTCAQAPPTCTPGLHLSLGKPFDTRPWSNTVTY